MGSVTREPQQEGKEQAERHAEQGEIVPRAQQDDKPRERHDRQRDQRNGGHHEIAGAVGEDAAQQQSEQSAPVERFHGQQIDGTHHEVERGETSHDGTARHKKIKKRRERQIDPAASRQHRRVAVREFREGAAADLQTERRETDFGGRVTGQQQHGGEMSRLMQQRREQAHEQQSAFVKEGDDGGNGEEVKTDIDTDAALDVT